MTEEIHKLHMEAGQICGKQKTCGKKHAYADEETATRGAAAHNRWEKRSHDVEPYPCAFCSSWHVGGIITEKQLRQIVHAGRVRGPVYMTHMTG
jgi:hypothetical protein